MKNIPSPTKAAYLKRLRSSGVVVRRSGVVVRVFGWEHWGSQFKFALLQRTGIPLRCLTVVDQSLEAMNLVVN